MEREIRTVFDKFADHQSLPLSRRTLIKRGAVLGLSIPVVSTLIAACGEVDDDVVDDDDIAEDDEEVAAVEDDDSDDDADDEPVDEPDEDDDEDEPTEAAEGGTIHFVMPELSTDPTTMSPLFSQGGGDQSAIMMHFGALLKMNREMEPEPELADSYEVSEDAIEYTFNLREDAEWSDGEPFTAEDVLFTFDCMVDPEVGSSRTGIFVHIRGARDYLEGNADSIEGVSAPDDQTVVVEMDRPLAIWAQNLASLIGTGIIPEHVYGEIERSELDGHELSRNPEVGAGPFLFSRWESEQFIEFTANENYVFGRPYLDGLVMMLMPNDTAMAQLETGELDLASVPFDELQRTEGLEHVNVQVADSVSITRFGVNNAREYLTTPVRHAMMYAIDFDGITEAAYYGLAEPHHWPVKGPDWMGDVVADADLNTWEYDPDRAREILEEEGWDPDQPVQLIYPTDMVEEMAAWTMVQSNLRDVGIDLQLVEFDFPAFRSARADGDFDLYLLRGGVPLTEPHSALNSITPDADGSENRISYNNEELTELIEEAITLTDNEERREIYLEVARIVDEELPYLYLWNPQIPVAVNQRVEGFEMAAHFTTFTWNVHEWSVTS